MNHAFKFDLGAKVKDRLTEFNGAIVSACTFFSSVDTYGVQPNALYNEQPVGVYYFDEDRLELVDAIKGKLGFASEEAK